MQHAQLIGLAGLAAERIHRALRLPGGIDGALRVLELHPLLNPAGYVVAESESDRLIVHRSPAHDDGAWISLCSPESVQPLQAIATAVDPHIEVRVSGTDTDWTAELAANRHRRKGTARGVRGQGQSRIDIPVRAEAFAAAHRGVTTTHSVKGTSIPFR